MERQHASEPESTFNECTLGCPTMVVIPAGKFMMGAAADEGSGQEQPQHQVVLATPFAIGRVEVTIGEWRKCVAAGRCRAVPFPDGWGADDLPVVNVSWDDAESYVAWLSRMTGKRYRLPSEAEWEYAARAGSTSRYSFGANASDLRKYAWYSENSDESTHPVGLLAANAFGLKDVHGNVFEWCKDNWHQDYLDAPGNGAEWSGGDGSKRVVRGGAWDSTAFFARVAYRSNSEPAAYSTNVGFRVARTLTQ
jgi:formylglycine-generating enzyme required for sulfatase activity